MRGPSITPTHPPPLPLCAVRSLLSMVITLTTASLRGIHPMFGQIRHWHMLAGRGLVGAAAMTVFYESLQRASLPLPAPLAYPRPQPPLCMQALLSPSSPPVPYQRFVCACYWLSERSMRTFHLGEQSNAVRQ
jgi:hypothetical protein